MDMSAFVSMVTGGSGGAGAAFDASSTMQGVSVAAENNTQGFGGFVKLLAKALGGFGGEGNQNGLHGESAIEGLESVEDLEELSEDMLAFLQQLQPLEGQQQQVLQRLAELIVSGGLDADLLSGLDEDGLNELADWIAEGAGGLFEGLAEDLDLNEADQESVGSSEEGTLDFGLRRKYAALMQLQQLQRQVSEAGSNGASLLDLDALSGMSGEELGDLAEDILQALKDALNGVAEDSVDSSPMAEAIKAVAEANREALLASSGMDMQGQSGDLSAETLIKNADVATLRQVMENALQNAGVDKELPQLPEVVLRSLALEMIQVSEEGQTENSERNGLFNSLGSNSGLREQLLQELTQISEEDTEGTRNQSSEKIIQTIESMLDEDGTEGSDGKIILASEGKGATKQSEASLSTEGDLAGMADEALTGDEIGSELGEQSEDNSQQNHGNGANAQTVLHMNQKQDGAAETVGADKMFDLSGKDALNLENVDEKTLETLLTAATDGGDSDASGTDADDMEFTEGLARLLDVDDSANDTKVKAPSQTDSSLRQQQLQENIDRLEKMLQISKGKNLKNVTMELNPRELGKMVIDVSYHDGKVHTTIRTENEAARDMLMNGAEQMKKNLEAQGVKIETFEVFVDRDGGGEERNREAWTAAQNGRERNRKRGNGSSGSAGGQGSDSIEEITGETDSLGVTTDGRVNLLA